MFDIPLIITCAVTGAELTRDDYPCLPLAPDEIADSACEAVNAGASIIHLHVRDKNGKPTQSVEVFKETTGKILSRCDAIIQYSTGGAVGTSLEERCEPLSLCPEMASLTMGTMNFGKDIFENSENTIIRIAEVMKKNGVMPELEIFDMGMLESVQRYLDQNLLPEKYHVNFVLGVPGGMNGSIENLVALVSRLPAGRTWTAAGIGKYQLPIAVHAAVMGGHARVGIEDNIYYRKGELALSSAQMVDRIVRIASELDRPVATVDEARKILGL